MTRLTFTAFLLSPSPRVRKMPPMRSTPVKSGFRMNTSSSASKAICRLRRLAVSALPMVWMPFTRSGHVRKNLRNWSKRLA